jgi:hypothetical protein
MPQRQDMEHAVPAHAITWPASQIARPSSRNGDHEFVIVHFVRHVNKDLRKSSQ